MSSPEQSLTLGPAATLGTAPDLVIRARELAAQANSVSVDCAELRQCDVAGLQVLLALRNGLTARGGTLRIVNVPGELAWCFDYAGLLYTTQ
jgi:ABC-type transporter Mla MlaB component